VTAGNLAVASRRQTPFGESRGGAASWNQHGFVGGTREESGLTRVGARLYDSSAGRFLSADPVVDNNDPQQLNGYAYSNNSPVTFSDPSGLYLEGGIGSDGHSYGIDKERGIIVGNDDAGDKSYAAAYPGAANKRSVAHGAYNAVRQGLRDAGISEAEYQEALSNAHRSKWDVIKDVAWEMLKDISGWNDIVDCFTKGDVWACGGLVMNLVPWGKVGKVLEAGYKAVRATVMMAKVIEKAQGLLRRVEKITAAAQEIAAKAMQKLGGKADDFGGSCPVRHSFVAGTRVLMADGSSKPIDQIQVGDKVKATDPTSDQTSDREVVATIVHTDEGDMTRLSVAGGSVDATSWHPVWVEERGDFAKIGTLQPGEHLRSADGTLVVVSSVEHYDQVQSVYDLTVDGVHTYYVVANNTPTLVHNCGGYFTGHADSCTCEGIGDITLEPVVEVAETADDASDLTRHSMQRMQQRGVSEEDARAVLNAQPFSYYHDDQWKMGHYDPNSGVFIAKTIDGNVNTVMTNVSQAYIDRLQKKGRG